jgi:hypothetical protein
MERLWPYYLEGAVLVYNVVVFPLLVLDYSLIFLGLRIVS